jgi:hypothetical protein
MFENREERPRNRDGGWEVTFWRRKCICSRSSLEEESFEEKNKTNRYKGGNSENAYSARKTKTFVQTPGGSFKALVPKASNAVSMTRIVVQPW